MDLLLSAWVKWQQGGNPKIQVFEITPWRNFKNEQGATLLGFAIALNTGQPVGRISYNRLTHFNSLFAVGL